MACRRELEALRLPARQHGRIVSTRSLLVPDITPPPSQAAAQAKAALEAAEMMPLWEVAARTGVEIAIYVILGLMVVRFAKQLAQRADRVSEPLESWHRIAVGI